jgi:hypothetical protein
MIFCLREHCSVFEADFHHGQLNGTTQIAVIFQSLISIKDQWTGGIDRDRE